MTQERRDAFYERGYTLRQAGRSDLAAREFERAIEVDPQSARSYAMLALCRYDLGSHAPAVEAARAALTLDPGDAFVSRAMGWALLGASRPSDARPHAVEAVRLDPQSPYAYLLLAEVELLSARYPEALQAAEQALAIDPNQAYAHRQRSVALRRLGRLGESRSAAETGLALEPDSYSSHVILARVAAEQRDATTAARAWREALRLGPASQEARSGLVLAMKSKNVAYRCASAFHDWYFRRGLSTRVAMLYASAILTMGIGAAVLLVMLAAGRSADPVANVVLRFDRYGRALLAPEQVVAADHLLKVVLAFGLAVPIGVLGGGVLLIIDAALLGVLVPTVAAARNCTPGRPRRWMAGYLACTVGVLGVANLLVCIGVSGWPVLPFIVGAVMLSAGEAAARRCGYPWSHRFDALSR